MRDRVSRRDVCRGLIVIGALAATPAWATVTRSDNRSTLVLRIAEQRAQGGILISDDVCLYRESVGSLNPPSTMRSPS